LPLYNKIRQICKNHDCYIDHINGIEDHVHLLIELKPKHCISDIVKTIKGNSWLWIRDENLSKGYFSWQDGFAAISISPSDLERVRRYIRNQEVYHKKKCFEEEMRTLNPKILLNESP
jgi:REP element-mobilizing transposase RayT